MHTTKVLHTLLSRSAPTIHQVRLTSFVDIVESLTTGAKACVTQLGRGLQGSSYDKHKIKRVDRLVSNPHLHQECDVLYASVAESLLKGLSTVIILIDWSPLCANQKWQLLRAAIPVGGRTLTLYEQVHPQSKLNNRCVQHRFLDRLATLIPSVCDVTIIADGGFKTPFYRHIENTLGWHWVGRIRGTDYVCATAEQRWIPSKSLFEIATTKPKTLGAFQWVRTNPLSVNLVIFQQYRQPYKLKNKPKICKRNYVHTRRAQEPWLLVTSRSLNAHTAKQIVSLYRTRMQIEEGFRDTKSTQFGLGLSQYPHMNPRRRAVLCLIASCALFVLWCIGTAVKQSNLIKQFTVSSKRKRPPYSAIFLARLLLKRKRYKLSERRFNEAINQVQPYIEAILC